MLLNSRRSRWTLSQCSVTLQTHGMSRLKLGESTGASSRTNPAPRQKGQLPSSEERGVLSPEVLLGIEMFFMISPIGFICTALRCPVIEDALDITPVALVVSNCFADGVPYPLFRIGVQCFSQSISHD